jgi:hypothetical protein
MILPANDFAKSMPESHLLLATCSNPLHAQSVEMSPAGVGLVFCAALRETLAIGSDWIEQGSDLLEGVAEKVLSA